MMKKRNLLLGIIMVFLISSCLKENHTIRIKNNYSSAITKADAGNANFGEIGTGAYSSYESINTGEFTFHLTLASGSAFEGKGNISGKGKHKWTLSVGPGSEVSLDEDKK